MWLEVTLQGIENYRALVVKGRRGKEQQKTVRWGKCMVTSFTKRQLVTSVKAPTTTTSHHHPPPLLPFSFQQVYIYICLCFSDTFRMFDSLAHTYFYLTALVLYLVLLVGERPGFRAQPSSPQGSTTATTATTVTTILIQPSIVRYFLNFITGNFMNH